MTPPPVTLRSPLGFAFRVFACTMLLCAFTCYRAIAFSWGTAGTYQYTRDDGVWSSTERLGGSPGYCRTYTGTEIAIESGRVVVNNYHSNVVRPPTVARVLERTKPRFSMRIPEPLGFGSKSLIGAMFIPERPAFVISRPPPEWPHVTAVPLWPIGLLTIIPALRYARYRYTQRIQRRRKRKGCCIECGYDLRHSPTRCPECGLETPAPDELKVIRRAA